MPNINVFADEHILSPAEQTWKHYSSQQIAMAALWALGLLFFLLVFAPFIAPHAPDLRQAHLLLQPPSWDDQGTVDYFLGTDDLGRDVLSRLLYGLRLTFGNALLVSFIALIIGTTIGISAAISSGLLSSTLHHIMDTALSIPSLLLAIIFISVLGPGLDHSLLAILLASIPQFIRGVYLSVYQELQKEYIIALKLDGANNYRIIRYGVFPNIIETLVNLLTRAISSAIIDISALGFLGLGAQRPLSEWGTMLSGATDLVFIAPWTVILPGLAILVTIFIINIVGESLRQSIIAGID
ncbi:ABC transporter permease subunit [Moritella sp. Urea-trap-13]|uniref:ABC transporter permease subunit n=1 Tax=Moritella sp. Urea-trap-13 TaxID=2058327 RepID=UPI000C321D25|nr:ABC transporter permease subunit [Moritella sp. Urea-trap-13]PKH09516.1 peptide ABC transporter permease [Moritella sp. Urea-trap-13]